MTLPAVRHDLTSLPARDRGQQDDSHNDWTYETGSAQVEQGDQLRAVAHPKYLDTLDRLMAEPEEIQRIVKSGGGRYTMPMQDIVQSVTGAATDCYQPGEELNRFVENMTPIINRIPEYAALEVDGASGGASSTPAASSTSTPTAGSAPASEPTPTPEPTPTLSEEAEAAAEHEAGDVPMEYWADPVS